MGVDKQFIYNKSENEGGAGGGGGGAGGGGLGGGGGGGGGAGGSGIPSADSMKSKAASFFSSITNKGSSVAKAKRDMSSVASCSLIKGKPRMFQITFKDDGKDAANREYEAETKMEAAEIVAKINFLMRNLK